MSDKKLLIAFMEEAKKASRKYTDEKITEAGTGEPGPRGPQGEPGTTPNIQIGKVTTGESGSPASASITGTIENPLLNLSIPRGLQGGKGDPGPKGDPGIGGGIYPGDPYEGVDLTVAFANEIAAAPYNGDAWAWIKARKTAGDYSGIHVGDYIPFTTSNSVNLKAQIIGLNTYKNYGDQVVGNHIDFCCKELWPTLKPVNPVNFNNGLIPVEDVVSDGVSTSYTLTKEMNGISKIMLGAETLTGYTYDPATYTITFDAAPASGTLNVTGTGTQHPWLASDIYHWANSLAGQVPNGTTKNPPVKHVDYTQDGIYYFLPDALKAQIIEKRMLLPTRYSATNILNNSNSWAWANLGKIWFPNEIEVYGFPVYANNQMEIATAVQYPLFRGNMARVKSRNGSRTTWWLLSAHSGNTTYWCTVSNTGYANNNNASHTNIAAPVCFRI